MTPSRMRELSRELPYDRLYEMRVNYRLISIMRCFESERIIAESAEEIALEKHGVPTGTQPNLSLFHIAPIRSHANFDFERHFEFVRVFHLLAH